MAEEVIGLLFGVEGGENIDGASGKRIVQELTKLVKAINSKESQIPKIELHFDTAKADDELKSLKKQLQEIASIASKITIAETPEQKAQKSNYSKRIASIKEYYAALKEMQSLQSKGVGGLSRGDDGLWSTTDQDHYGQRVANLNSLLKEYQQIINVVGDSEHTEAQKAKALGVSAQQYTQILEANTRAINENAIAKERLETSDFEREQADDYRKLSKTMREYYSERQKLSKAESINSNSEDYDKRTSRIEELQAELKKFGVTLAENGDIEKKSLEQAKVGAQERTLLEEQLSSAQAKNNIAQQEYTRTASNAWRKASQNAYDYVNRIKDVASKDLKAKKLMGEVLDIAKSDDPKKVNEVNAALGRLQQRIKETGADVENFGQKFLKSFGANLRATLAMMVIAQVGKSLRDVYDNVVKLDKAMTDLQIASGKSRGEIKQLTREYAKLAKQLGATTLEVAEAADTWLRQGYTAEETNALIANSTMLAKLGQMEAAEASEALTSAMKGYNVSAEDSIKIVDRLVAVDMAAAASAGDIATAMAETATSADIAGISMDRLVGYIATVKEVTQDGAESVGNFYKTLFARMGKVQSGADVDDEGESLNDVENVLRSLDISLRNSEGSFRNFGEVLDEVGAKWESYDNVVQHQIATAFAGTRQQEKFIVLMQNYSQAMEYASLATESAGTANEKYSAYTNSIEGSVRSLEAAFEDLSMTLLDSGLIIGFIDFLSAAVEFLNSIASLTGNVLVEIPAIIIALSTLYSIVSQIKSTAMFGTMLTGLKSVLAVFPALLAGFRSIIANLSLQAAGHKLTAASLVAQAQATQAATAAQQAFNATNPIGWIILAVTAIYALAKAFDFFGDKQREKVEEYEKRADEQDELVEKYDSEIDALTSLQEKLQDAHGNKAKLAKIYDELNKKVSVSTDLLNGEEAAYLAVNLQLQDQIKAQQKAREEADKAAIAAKRSAFNERTLTRKGLVSYILPVLFGTDPWLLWDWMAADATGEEIRQLMRGTLPGVDMNYDKFYNKMTTDEQNRWLGLNGIEREDWDEFWDAQVKLAKESLANTIESADGAFDSEFMSDAVERLVLSGYDIDEVLVAVNEILDANSEMNSLQSDYYKALITNGADATAIYEQMQDKLAQLKTLYPELSSKFDAWISGISTSISVDTDSVTVALKSAKEILEEVQDGYDGLSEAMNNLTSEGYLNADSLATVLGLIEDNMLAGLTLEDVLIRDANGYKLVDNVLQKYVQAVITANTVTKALATKRDAENYIANLQMIQAVLATLTQTQDDSTDAIKSQREELEKQGDVYDDQLDSYRELIDIRKDLLSTYEEELSYQKELAKRQRNVTQLQTKLAVAQLDTSAAGQARVRELEAELREAQDELDDFTLEHAIDVISDQLESQYSEYEAFIKTKLNEIETLLEGLETSTEVNITVDNTWVAEAISQINQLINDVKDPFSVDNPPTLRRPLDISLIKTDDLEPQGTPHMYYYSGGGVDRYLSIDNFHTGGFVGGVSQLASNEEFAKLLKGEFVSTPSQMKRFMEETLPKMANYSASANANEFNAPLIEIVCESVTSESMPRLKEVIDEAVKEIKKQLDSGVSRTGYKRPVKPI